MRYIFWRAKLGFSQLLGFAPAVLFTAFPQLRDNQTCGRNPEGFKSPTRARTQTFVESNKILPIADMEAARLAYILGW